MIEQTVKYEYKDAYRFEVMVTVTRKEEAYFASTAFIMYAEDTEGKDCKKIIDAIGDYLKYVIKTKKANDLNPNNNY